MKTAILARHGESQFSVRGIVNGDPGASCPLTDTGREQARLLAATIADAAIDLCVVTEFARTQETADIALEGRDVPRLVVPELNDVRFGEFEGRPLTDYRAWAGDNEPTIDAPGGGESRAATVDRYVRGFDKVLRRREPTILAVIHGLPIRYVLNALEDIDPAPLVDQVTYATAYAVSDDELRRAVERLRAWAERPAWSRG